MTSFYDWYADLPVASPQVFGDQTDVPESGDWWDATYLMMWGSNVPVTRTPDAHWMAEVRYRGTKVVTVSPDYADNTKFADEWLPAQAGTDAALAMAMGHVILNEFFVDRRVPFFVDYVRQYTDLPFLVTLTEHRTVSAAAPGGGLVPGKFLHRRRPGTSGTPVDRPRGRPGRRCCWTPPPASRWCPTARWASATPNRAKGSGTSISTVSPRRCHCGTPRSRPSRPRCCCPTSPIPAARAAVLRRGVPVTRVNGRLVTTVFDLMLAQYGVGRAGSAGRVADRLRRRVQPVHPGLAGRDHQRAGRGVHPDRPRVRRTTPRSPKGRSMIIMGAGICQWFHADATYRSILSLLILTGAMGRNGGGWAHYVGQEKCRPITGWISLANGLDWSRPPRTMIGTAFWYMHTDQWRFDGYSGRRSGLAAGRGQPDADAHRRHDRPVGPAGLDAVLPAVRREPAGSGRPGARRRWRPARPPTPAAYVANQLADGTLKPSIADVDAPENWPRTLDPVALQPDGLLGQGQRVLPEAPARHPLQRDGHRGRRGRPAEGRRPGGRSRRRASSTCCCRPTSG